MIYIPNNLPNFLLTQISGREKPFILKAADYLLAPLRIPTSFEETVINGEGLPRKTEYRGIGVPDQVAAIMKISSAIFLTSSPLLQAIIGSVYLSGVFIATSLAIGGTKDLNTYFFKKIDERGDFLGCKLLKGVTLVISASLPIFVGSFGLLGLHIIFGVTITPVISLIGLGCLALQLSAGALLKVIAYNRNPKIKSAYDKYLNKTKNPDLKLPDSKNEVVDNSNKIEQGVAKLQNNENLGFFNDLNRDVLGSILSSYLPVNDLIQFRTTNKKLSEVFSNKMIIILRIQDSFSIDFINKLGLERILNAMEHDPLDPFLVPMDLLTAFRKDEVFNFERDNDRALSFDLHMENKSIVWGHVSVQTPKNKSKLFLIFNDINKPSSLIKPIKKGKYFMITPHDNSEISWEQRSIHQIRSGVFHFALNSPIYKVNDDNYSTKPISQLQVIDYQDNKIVRETGFFKNFKNPETQVQI